MKWRTRRRRRYSEDFSKSLVIPDTGNDLYEYFENVLTKRKLVYDEISRIWEILILIPGIVGIITLVHVFMSQSVDAFLLAMALIFLTIVFDYLVVWWVLNHRYMVKASLYRVKNTNTKYEDVRVSFLRKKLHEKELDDPEKLAHLAQIIEMKANSKGNNMLYLISLIGIFFYRYGVGMFHGYIAKLKMGQQKQ